MIYDRTLVRCFAWTLLYFKLWYIRVPVRFVRFVGLHKCKEYKRLRKSTSVKKDLIYFWLVSWRLCLIVIRRTFKDKGLLICFYVNQDAYRESLTITRLSRESTVVPSLSKLRKNVRRCFSQECVSNFRQSATHELNISAAIKQAKVHPLY